jgi:formamidase
VLPNACCTISIPTDMFDADIRPSADGPTVVDRGQVAQTS